jgi:hypothetical protein
MTNALPYAPFPEQELEALADHFENIARAWSDQTVVGARLKQECNDRALVCRNAIASYVTLREQFLLGRTPMIDPMLTLDSDGTLPPLDEDALADGSPD